MRYRQLSSLARSWRVENRVLTAVGVRGLLMSRRPSSATVPPKAGGPGGPVVSSRTPRPPVAREAGR